MATLYHLLRAEAVNLGSQSGSQPATVNDTGLGAPIENISHFKVYARFLNPLLRRLRFIVTLKSALLTPDFMMTLVCIGAQDRDHASDF